MAWLYVPDMEGLNSELNEFYQDQEPFVMWRGNVLPFNTLSKKWKKVPWMQRLSGLTSKPSTASLGVEKWIGSVEDSHANPIQLLENNWEKQTLATSGRILSESLGKCDQDSYSLKMFQTSLKCDLIPLSLTSTNWGMMLHGVLWRLPTLVPPTVEEDGSAWPSFATPTVMDAGEWTKIRKVAKESLAQGKWRGINLRTSAIMIPTPNAADGMRTNSVHQRGNLTLKGYAEKWPTPTAMSGGQGIAPSHVKGTHGINLGAAVKLKEMFPIPGASDAIKSGNYKPGTKKQSQKSLVALAKANFPTPAARDWKGPYPRKNGGGLPDLVEKWKKDGEEALKNSGRLNPQWVAWLMGLPIGWINSEYSEME
jgi:hypothetical protein